VLTRLYLTMRPIYTSVPRHRRVRLQNGEGGAIAAGLPELSSFIILSPAWRGRRYCAGRGQTSVRTQAVELIFSTSCEARGLGGGQIDAGIGDDGNFLTLPKIRHPHAIIPSRIYFQIIASSSDMMCG
jgi:hypothetical protein